MPNNTYLPKVNLKSSLLLSSYQSTEIYGLEVFELIYEADIVADRDDCSFEII